MGKINQGILGGVSGKVGNVVGGNWKGIDYLRIMPASVANPKTPAQVDQRSKFVTVLRFLQSITPFLRVGYKNQAIKMTQFNSAMSDTLKNSVTGTYPNYVIDYGNVLLSKGTLPNVLNPTANSAIPGNNIAFSWTDNSGMGDASAMDKALVVVYCPELKDATYITEGGSSRDAEGHTIAVPSSYAGKDVEVYISMISENGSKVSNSLHVATVTM
ncbi:MAG: hypothetical protein KAH25_01475 [Bacteroidales bacterium]|nr:hypothetical protein [Bacteroidales bacterium]